MSSVTQGCLPKTPRPRGRALTHPAESIKRDSVRFRPAIPSLPHYLEAVDYLAMNRTQSAESFKLTGVNGSDGGTRFSDAVQIQSSISAGAFHCALTSEFSHRWKRSAGMNDIHNYLLNFF